MLLFGYFEASLGLVVIVVHRRVLSGEEGRFGFVTMLDVRQDVLVEHIEARLRAPVTTPR